MTTNTQITESLMHRAAALIAWMSVRDAVGVLVEDGVDPGVAYLAAVAGLRIVQVSENPNGTV